MITHYFIAMCSEWLYNVKAYRLACRLRPSSVFSVLNYRL